MRVANWSHILLFLSLFIATSCSKEEFSSTPRKNTSSSAQSAVSCNIFSSGSHTDKPKVDILFVIDNSSSMNFISDGVKKSISDVVSTVSEEFDYHIMLVPFFTTGLSTDTQLITYNTDGLTASALNMITSIDSFQMFSSSSSVSTQHAFERATETINTNISNGIFRDDSYLLTIVVSNEDENAYDTNGSGRVSSSEKHAYVSNQVSEFKSIKQSLNSQQVRVMSVVPHSKCGSGYEVGSLYIQLSGELYGNSGASDQTGRIYPDSYDLCHQGEYEELFEGVNNSIHQLLIGHTYQWIKIADYGSSLDSENIYIQNITTGTVIPQVSQDQSSQADAGFVYIGQQTEHPTRSEPDEGEYDTGHFIELLGYSKLEYPEEIEVCTIAPTQYYGYIAIEAAPDTSSVEITITERYDSNGDLYNDASRVRQVPSSQWSYRSDLGYQSNFNIEIKSKSDFSNATPGTYRSGYIIQLSEDAVYKNGDSVKVNFRAKSL